MTTQQVPAAAGQAADRTATVVQFSHAEKVSPATVDTSAPPTTTPFEVA